MISSSNSLSPRLLVPVTAQADADRLTFKLELNPAFSGSDMIRATRENPLIHTFTLINCEGVWADVLKIAISNLTKLQSVTLSGKETYTSGIFRTLGENNPDLTYLSISDDRPRLAGDLAPLHTIAAHCRQLRFLHLYFPNKRYSDKELNKIMTLASEQWQSITLHSGSGLRLSHVKQLIKNAPNLTMCSLTVLEKHMLDIQKKLGKKIKPENLVLQTISKKP